MESYFFQFFAHPRGWKAIFFSFLLIQGVGKLFFQFFAHPRSRKVIFPHFSFIRDLG
ncbi:hypothetical protein HMPREF0971_02716 [Segatella oris F0302]|uniref:Uncharacterized protein n=1 Tax=Segatella oris F0302 TaxID=649760 RepID=D1QUN1_9BACT|nr:hypothetical protein HMPREF0971_02716 [Segatella oris F0302]